MSKKGKAFDFPETARRIIVEICCAENSVLGERAPQECTVIRITEAHDILNDDTMMAVRQVVYRAGSQGSPVLLWVSFPCTGGSLWQNRNWTIGSQEANNKIGKHWAYLRSMWGQFNKFIVPLFNDDIPGLELAWEWPATCSYWD